jgi:MbtH protein
MAVNIFDDEDGTFVVLVNGAGQYSLWPTLADIPKGWTTVFGESGRQECIDYVESHWSDLIPVAEQ